MQTHELDTHPLWITTFNWKWFKDSSFISQTMGLLEENRKQAQFSNGTRIPQWMKKKLLIRTISNSKRFWKSKKTIEERSQLRGENICKLYMW